MIEKNTAHIFIDLIELIQLKISRYLEIRGDRSVAWQNLRWRRIDLLQQKPTFFAISQQPRFAQQIGDGGATGKNSANISVIFFNFFNFFQLQSTGIYSASNGNIFD